MMTPRLFRHARPTFPPLPLVARRPVASVATGTRRGSTWRTIARSWGRLPVVSADNGGAQRRYSDFTISSILGLTHEASDDVDGRRSSLSMMPDLYEPPTFPGEPTYTQPNTALHIYDHKQYNRLGFHFRVYHKTLCVYFGSYMINFYIALIARLIIQPFINEVMSTCIAHNENVNKLTLVKETPVIPGKQQTPISLSLIHI